MIKVICVFVLIFTLIVTLGACDMGNETTDVEPTYYDLVIKIRGEGSTNPEPGIYEYERDEMVEIEAEPEEGYKFENWHGSVQEPEKANTSIIMEDNKNVSAIFVEKGDEEDKLLASVPSLEYIDDSTEIKAEKIYWHKAVREEGFNFPYLVYFGEGWEDKEHILVQGNNSISSSDDWIHHIERGIEKAESSTYARDLGKVKLLPIFPRARYDQPEGIKEDSMANLQSLDRQTFFVSEEEDSYRIDLQLKAMIEHFIGIMKTNLGVEKSDDVLMFGISSSGNFTSRFALLHPQRVKAAVGGAVNGLPLMPIKEYNGIELTYPNGISDLEKLNLSYDEQDTREVDILLAMGEEDENDTLPYHDTYDDQQRAEILKAYHPEIYEKVDDPHNHEELVEKLDGEDMLERWYEQEEIFKKEGYDNVITLTTSMGHETFGYGTTYREKVLNFFGKDGNIGDF